MIYSLLISERFKNSNPDNILLYIMDNPVREGFEYIKQSKLELDSLILGRNELAKWHQLNSQKIEMSKRGFVYGGLYKKCENSTEDELS